MNPRLFKAIARIRIHHQNPSRGRGSTRRCVSPTCCYSQADSAPSCSIRVAFCLNMCQGFHSLPGFATAQPRSRRNRASSLLTQHSCAKSSAGIVLKMDGAQPSEFGPTVFAGFSNRSELVRQRYEQETSNVVPMRKPPQRATSTEWISKTPWCPGSWRQQSMSDELYLCAYAREFPAQALLRMRPELRARPVAVFARRSSIPASMLAQT